MAILPGKNNMEKLKALGQRTYSEQAKWFMNAYWAKQLNDNTVLPLGDCPGECEKIWTYCQNMVNLDADGAAGSELAEFDAHRFLEKNTEALTWTDMRDALKELDIDFDKKVSLTEFLVHHYKVDWNHLVTAAQAMDAGAALAIAEAEKAVANAQAKRDECVAKLQQAEEDEDAATAAEADAKEAHDKQVEAEAEVKAILDTIKGYQNALKKRADALQKIIDDPDVGQVKKMKAKHELMDLKNGSRARRKGISECNPELLRKAKIDQKAAVRKAKRATAKAKAAAETAEEARVQAAETKEEAARAVKASAAAMEKAVAEVENVKASCKGAGQGTIWWMGRELEEQKKYLPQAQFRRLKKKHAKKVAKMKAEQEGNATA